MVKRSEQQQWIYRKSTTKGDFMYTTTDNIRVDMLIGLLRRNQILSA